MLEKHKNDQPFRLYEILFTRSEIHARTVEIFQMDIKDYVIKQITVGGFPT